MVQCPTPIPPPLDDKLNFRYARLTSYLSEAPYPGKKMGAALCKGNKVLALAPNSFSKTHTLQKSGLRNFLHAEINVILKRRHFDDLSSCYVVVYRESHNSPALAKPCLQCQSIMRDFGIKKVYYSIPCEPYYALLKL